MKNQMQTSHDIVMYYLHQMHQTHTFLFISANTLLLHIISARLDCLPSLQQYSFPKRMKDMFIVLLHNNNDH